MSINKPVRQFRQHRGGLRESMETVCTVTSLDDIYKLMELEKWGIENWLQIKHYTYDARTNWDTWMVTCEGYGVLGFTDGPLDL